MGIFKFSRFVSSAPVRHISYKPYFQDSHIVIKPFIMCSPNIIRISAFSLDSKNIEAVGETVDETVEELLERVISDRRGM